VGCYHIPSSYLLDPKTENEEKSQEKIEQKPHKKPSEKQARVDGIVEEITQAFARGGEDAVKEKIRQSLCALYGRMMGSAPPNARLTLAVRFPTHDGSPGLAFTITNEKDLGQIIYQLLSGDVIQADGKPFGKPEGEGQEPN